MAEGRRQATALIALAAAVAAGCGGNGDEPSKALVDRPLPKRAPRVELPPPVVEAARAAKEAARAARNAGPGRAPARRPPTGRRSPRSPAARTHRSQLGEADRRAKPTSSAAPAAVEPPPRCGDAARRADEAASPHSLWAVARVTACLVNARRSAAGLAPLGIDPALDRAALAHAVDMVRHRYFSHASRGGGLVAERARAAGYIRAGVRWIVGENLAWAGAELSSPRAVVEAWMRSPSHRANVLRPDYRELGVAVVWGVPSRKGSGATFDATFGVIRP